MSTENESAKRKLKISEYFKELETKGNVKNTSIEFVKSLVVTGAGVYLGAVIGRPSLAVGAGATVAGYYWDYPKLTQLGVGLMTTGGFQLKEKGFSGGEMGAIEVAKARAKEITSNLKHSLYLDKLFPPKTETKETKETKTQGTAGLGEAQYFNFSGGEGGTGSLENIEEAIRRSGEQFVSQTNRKPPEDFSGVEERLY